MVKVEGNLTETSAEEEIVPLSEPTLSPVITTCTSMCGFFIERTTIESAMEAKENVTWPDSSGMIPLKSSVLFLSQMIVVSIERYKPLLPTDTDALSRTFPPKLAVIRLFAILSGKVFCHFIIIDTGCPTEGSPSSLTERLNKDLLMAIVACTAASAVSKSLVPAVRVPLEILNDLSSKSWPISTPVILRVFLSPLFKSPIFQTELSRNGFTFESL